jgi:two-component system sensor histidine kinase/response regulator
MNPLKSIFEAFGQRGEPANTAKPISQGGDSRPLQILVAGGNRTTHNAMVIWLQADGHSVTVVEDGRSALEALEQDSIDLVLMDIQMPDMDGYQVTRAVRNREQSTGQHVHIIALIVGAMKSDLEICLDSGMDGFLPKPVDLKALKSMMNSLQPPVRLSMPPMKRLA